MYNSDDGSHKMTLMWVALGESFHLCRLKHHENSKPQPEKKTLSPAEEGRIRWELIVFALTHWELKKARYQKTFSLLVRPFVEGSFSSIPSFRRMGQTKKTKCFATKNAVFWILFSNCSCFKLITFHWQALTVTALISTVSLKVVSRLNFHYSIASFSCTCTW